MIPGIWKKINMFSFTIAVAHVLLFGSLQQSTVSLADLTPLLLDTIKQWLASNKKHFILAVLTLSEVEFCQRVLSPTFRQNLSKAM